MDADRSLSAALCPPSLGDQTDTDSGYLRWFVRGLAGRSAVDEGTIPFGFSGILSLVFDIVTVEGEGCSAAGWEEMSWGTRSG